MKGWLFAIVLTLVLPIYGQEKSPQPASYENDTKGAKKPDANKSPMPSDARIVVNQETADTQYDGTTNHPKSYLGRLFSPENLPNIGLFVAGIIGIIVAICTLKIIERQTTATEKSAEAALLNAQAVITAQRPWLFIPMGSEFSEIKGPTLPDVGDNRVAHTTFDLRNFGQSPARIMEQKAYLYIGASPESVPDPTAFGPQDATREDYAFPQGSVIHVQAMLHPNGFISPQDRAAVLTSARFLWLCGYCKYRNASDTGDVEPYETRFCYLWVSNTTRPQPFWILRGPREYNRAT